MYAREYYLLYIEEICYCKVTFDLLTFLPFAAYIKFTSFIINLVHYSLFHFHFFTFFSPFSLLFLSLSPPISPTVHSSLPHNIRDKD